MSSEWFEAELPGETVAIIVVFESGENESFKIRVSSDARYPIRVFFCPKARMHSFKFSKDVLISADSARL